MLASTGLLQTAFRIRIHTPVRFSTARHVSFWAPLQKQPLDNNHATAAAYEADTADLKVNLGRGVYKTDEGKDWVLPSVRMAEEQIHVNILDHGYLPFSGLKSFTGEASRFAFGDDSPALSEGRVATIQTISGTGALTVGAAFLSRFLKPTPRHIYLPAPTYVNHYPVFGLNGMEHRPYRYFDYNTNGLDFDGMIEDLSAADDGSVVLLHACAHNPTGVDPSLEQWNEICQVVKSKSLLPIFDSAYQGFASGDPDRDAASFRHFVDEAGLQALVCQSFAKNFGLYGQRVGALNVVTSSPEETKLVLSNLQAVVRPMYSNPPAHGARLVAAVLKDPALKQQWLLDVKTMADRIIGCRVKLVAKLKELGSARDWSHISNQIGMFAYSGLSESEVLALRERHVFMNVDGRMSMTGVNSSNVDYLAQCIHDVTKG